MKNCIISIDFLAISQVALGAGTAGQLANKVSVGQAAEILGRYP